MLLNMPKSLVLGQWLDDFRTLKWQDIGLEISIYEKM